MREPGEHETADQIAERHRDLIPQPPIGDRDLGAHHHAGRDDEHVDDRVLEALREEDEDRHPGGGDLADRGIRGHRQHDGEADHPVAQDRLDEDGHHAGDSRGPHSRRLGLGDRDDAAATPAGARVPMLVSAIASSAP